MLQNVPTGRHFAFEPFPELAERLRQTFPHVRVFEVALSDAPGTVSFQHVISNPSYSGLRPRRYDRPHENIQTITVRAERLDDLIPEDLPIAFIKIDVEGAELQVLGGATRVISRSRPFTVFEHGLGAADYDGTEPADVHDLLTRDCGMQVTLMSRWLAGRPPLTRKGFVSHFEREKDFYYLACR